LLIRRVEGLLSVGCATEGSAPMGRLDSGMMRLSGPFRVVLPGGATTAPPGKRAKAILAMLALSPDGVRSRAWLQDKLWSDRDGEHGAASLRQEISALRRFMREAGLDIVLADRDTVRIDLDAVRVETPSDGAAAPGQELLEGLDIRDEEFENWLREERSRWRARTTDGGGPAPDGWRATARALPGASSNPSRPALGIIAEYGASGDAAEETAADLILDLAARTLLSFDAVDILDYRGARGAVAARGDAEGPDWLLRVAASARGDALRISASLCAAGASRVAWTHTEGFTVAALYETDNIALGAFVNRIVYIVLDQIMNPRSLGDEDRHHAARLALGAIYQIFRLGDADLDAADRMLTHAYEVDPRSTYLGWRVFINITRVGERRTMRDPASDARMRDMMGRALDADPYNPLTLSLCALSHGFVFREYDCALDLADRAVAANPLHAIACDIRALTLGYMGELELGYRDAMRARALGGPPPYQHCIDTTCCILATLSGRFAEGVRHGERAMARQPSYSPTLRYTAASLGHLSRTAEAGALLKRLRKFEPDFTIGLLRDNDYPVAGVLGAAVIEKGLASVALAHEAG